MIAKLDGYVLESVGAVPGVVERLRACGFSARKTGAYLFETDAPRDCVDAACAASLAEKRKCNTSYTRGTRRACSAGMTTEEIHGLYRAYIAAGDVFSEAVKRAYGNYLQRYRPSFKGEPEVEAAYAAMRSAEKAYFDACKLQRDAS